MTDYYLKKEKIFKAFYKNKNADMTYSIAHSFFENVRKYLKNENWFFDMTEVFKGVNESAYLDEIHYTNFGHRIIGKYILNTISHCKI